LAWAQAAFSSTAELVELGVLSHLDHELGRTLLDISGEHESEGADAVALGAAFASWAVQRGHVCVDLAQLDARGFQDDKGSPIEGIRLPQPEAWAAALSPSKLVAIGGQDETARRPLILVQQTRLYLARYFDYEQRLAEALLKRSRRQLETLDGPLLKRGLDALFPSTTPGTEGQRRACLLATLRGLSVISGGPGTGKTYTVAKVLSLLQEQALAAGREPLRIQLLAPTGKAAQRLGEAIQQNLASLPEALRSLVPAEASTLHRALGYQRNTPTRFRHGALNPLPADVVIVDEASMVDLALMAKLVDAVHPRARLVLLGDKDQLASVEAGAILGEIYGGNPDDGYSRELAESVQRLTGDAVPVSPTLPNPGLHDCMVHLSYVHRFAGGSPIAKLAQAVNAGDVEAAFAVLDAPEPEVDLRPIAAEAELPKIFGALVEDRFGALRDGTVADKLRALSSFRFLCAHRRGKLGVGGLNRFVAEHLTRRGLLDARGDWYDGRPILVTANDYSLDLFNGDVGIIAEDPKADPSEAARRPLLAFFPSSHSSEPRQFPPGQLPPHETVFAMSVHKAQGSELDEVALVLPDRMSPILTRELIYTGITRAKKRVTIYGTREVLAAAIEARVQRASGLGEALWPALRGRRTPV